jgi:hypothetical protein
MRRRACDNGASIASARASFVDPRVVRRRCRPQITSPLPGGYAPAVLH